MAGAPRTTTTADDVVNVPAATAAGTAFAASEAPSGGTPSRDPEAAPEARTRKRLDGVGGAAPPSPPARTPPRITCAQAREARKLDPSSTGDTRHQRAPILRPVAPDRLAYLKAKALSATGFVSPDDPLKVVNWDVSCGCHHPVDIGLTPELVPARKRLGGVILETTAATNPELILRTRCRKCEPCLDLRRRLWTARGVLEFRQAVDRGDRVWFGTLTLGREARFRYRKAIKLMHRPQEADLVRAAWSEFGPDITKMWKRLRKKGARFRYLIVAELHKDRTPHFHVNLYEDGAKVSWRQLSAEWPHGFTRWELVKSERNAAYAAKYMQKAGSKLRCSLHFGKRTFPNASTADQLLATVGTTDNTLEEHSDQRERASSQRDDTTTPPTHDANRRPRVRGFACGGTALSGASDDVLSYDGPRAPTEPASEGRRLSSVPERAAQACAGSQGPGQRQCGPDPRGQRQRAAERAAAARRFSKRSE